MPPPGVRPPAITGAVTARMEESPTDPRRHAPNRSRDEITGARARPARRQLAILGGAVLVGLGTIGLVTSWVMDANASAALAVSVASTSDDGGLASMREALAQIEGDDSPEVVALRARLLATRAIEMGVGDWAEADAELGTLDTAGGALLDARVARALVALTRGQADQAATLLSGVEGTDVPLAEALHAQALALEALGQLAQASEAAHQAATLRPNAARHAALSARLELALGDVPRATATLATVPNGEASPLVRLARARIALAAFDYPRVDAEAQAVLGPLLASASPLDVAQAHYAHARAALGTNDAASARTALDAAAALLPPADETFALELAEAYLAVGAADRATALVSTLSTQTSSPERRARVVVEVALAANDLAAADRALAALGATPRAELLRARVRQRQGRNDEARMLYERAASDPGVGTEARTREGELLVAMGRAQDARLVLEQALRAVPTDAHVAELFVRVAVETRDLAAAEAALAPALGANPTSVALRAAHARVLLAQGHAAEALAELRTAATAAPTDAGIQSALGDAAYATGDRVTAVAAYEALLGLSESAAAHLSLASVLAEDTRFDEATTHVDRAAALGAPALDVTRHRLRIAVMRGLGAMAFDAARQATDANGSDALVWALRGTLELQAEDFPDADDSITRALRLAPDSPDALLARAALAIEEGALPASARTLDRAERAGSGPSFQARVRSLRGRLRFEGSDFDDARRLADEALALDAHCGAAHLLLADVAIDAGDDPVPHLRAAVAATATAPDAVGRLALRLERTAEGCALGRTYLERVDDSAYFASDVEAATRRCR